MAARGVAHLDLGHSECDGWMSDEQFNDAVGLSRVRMDDPEQWTPEGELAVDGEPSQRPY